MTTGAPFFHKQVFLDSKSNVKRVVIETALPLVIAQGKDYDRYKTDGGTEQIFRVPESADLEVYADELILFGTIRLPGRNANLVARTLNCLSKAKSGAKGIGIPVIDVSGADVAELPPPPLWPGAPGPNDAQNTKGKVAFGRTGDPGQANRIFPIPEPHDSDTPGQPGGGRQRGADYDPVMDGEPGAEGIAGGHAGSIGILAGTICFNGEREVPPNTIRSAICLRLVANGGRGGDGQQGQWGGAGGQGGSGASCRSGQGVAGLGHTVATDGGPGGDGGNGGKGGTGGRGGDSGQIVVRSRSPATALQLSCLFENMRGQRGKPGEGGPGGRKGPGGPGGRGCQPVKAYSGPSPVIKWLADRVDAEVLNANVPDGRDGEDGIDGQRGVSGGEGSDGEQKPCSIDLNRSKDVLTSELSMAARVGLLELMIQRARASFLSLDAFDETSADWMRLGETLDWIKQRLDSFPVSRTGGTDCSAEHALARRLTDVVNPMLAHHAANCDYFGKSPLFAPTLSLKTYDDALTKALECLQLLEAGRDGLAKTLDANETALAHLEDGREEARSVGDYLRTKLRDLTEKRRSRHRQLLAAEQEREDLRKGLERALHEFGERVQRSFGLSTAELLNALTQIAFMGLPVEKKAGQTGAGGAAAAVAVAEAAAGAAFEFSPVHAANSAIMGGIQLASLIDAGNKSVLNDSGEPVDKKYVMKQVARANESLRATLSEWKADGSIQVDQQGMTQLLCSRQELDEMLDEFGKLDGALAAKSRLDTYVEQVDARNRLIADYNDLLVSEYGLLAEIQKADEQTRQMDTRLSLEQKPGLAQVGMWISGLYETVKTTCLEEVYMAHRAESFWAAAPYSGLHQLMAGKKIEVVDRSGIVAAQSQVRANLLSHLEEALATPSRFPDSDDAKETGVLVVLTPDTHPSLFQDLTSADVKRPGDAGKRPPIVVHFKLPLSTKDSDISESAFHGKADVRLAKVRPYLIGMKTRSDHMLTIVHSGDERIQTRDDQTRRFVHDPRPIPFAYTPDPAWLSLVIPPLQDGTQAEGPPRPPGAARFGPTLMAANPAGNPRPRPLDWRVVLAGASVLEGGTIELPRRGAETKDLCNAGYAPIGPFTKWTLTIKYSDHADLDLAGLKAIVIDFHGFFRTFD